MTRFGFAILAATCLSACAANTPDATTQPEAQTESDIQTPLQLTEVWALDGFDAPESVIPTPSGDGYFVSNVGGDSTDADNNGAISLIGRDGTMINRNWVTGTDTVPLHAPKGMTVVENEKGVTLLVTDVDHVAFILTGEGRLAKRLPAPGAEFLNDIAKGPDASAFISDSAGDRIYKLENDAITIWLENERLGGVNGLQMVGDRLLATTMRGGELLSIDLETKAITGLAAGMENADGIGLRSDGSYIITSWPGQIWHARTGEAPELLQDTSSSTVNIDDELLMNDIYLVDDNLLITPNCMPGTVRAYRID
ncbi:MAG: hypothetical protein AAF926_08075 [Pseudomonadota bacterium]